jgi:hypothetical protein
MAIFMQCAQAKTGFVKNRRVCAGRRIPYYKTREFPLQICCKSLSASMPPCTISLYFSPPLAVKFLHRSEPTSLGIIPLSGLRGRPSDRSDKTAVPLTLAEPQANDDPAVPGQDRILYWHWR